MLSSWTHQITQKSIYLLPLIWSLSLKLTVRKYQPMMHTEHFSYILDISSWFSSQSQTQSNLLSYWMQEIITQASLTQYRYQKRNHWGKLEFSYLIFMRLRSNPFLCQSMGSCLNFNLFLEWYTAETLNPMKNFKRTQDIWNFRSKKKMLFSSYHCLNSTL